MEGGRKDLEKRKKVWFLIKTPNICINTFVLNDVLMCFLNKQLTKSRISYFSQFINNLLFGLQQKGTLC